MTSDAGVEQAPQSTQNLRNDADVGLCYMTEDSRRAESTRRRMHSEQTLLDPRVKPSRTQRKILAVDAEELLSSKIILRDEGSPQALTASAESGKRRDYP